MSMQAELLLDLSTTGTDVNEFLSEYTAPGHSGFLASNEVGIFLDGDLEDLLTGLGIKLKKIETEVFSMSQTESGKTIIVNYVVWPEDHGDEIVDEIVIDFNTIRTIDDLN